MEREADLKEIHGEIRGAPQCPLHSGADKDRARRRTDGCAGDVHRRGPGFHEDQQGVPFVGAAGRFLNELLEKVGIDRKRVFITNVIKCRPPGNRDPLPEEVEACKDYLDRQIEVIRPQVIVTLGRHSMAQAFPDEKVSRVHGQARQVGEQVYFPMYHPAAALHQPSLRSVVEADFERLRDLLDGRLTPEVYTPPPEAEQLSLF